MNIRINVKCYKLFSSKIVNFDLPFFLDLMVNRS